MVATAIGELAVALGGSQCTGGDGGSTDDCGNGSDGGDIGSDRGNQH